MLKMDVLKLSIEGTTLGIVRQDLLVKGDRR
jgi:hypothetical protein